MWSAFHKFHVLLCVTLAGFVLKRVINSGFVIFGEENIDCLAILDKPVYLSRARNGYDIRSARKAPGKGDLRRCSPMSGCYGSHRFHHFQIVLKILFLKARVVVAHVSFFEETF